MAFIDDLHDLMPDTATWEPLAARDDYGAPSYGAPTPLDNVRLVRKAKRVRDASGDEVISTAQLWVGGIEAIRSVDRVTLSDGTAPPIAMVERFQDETGLSHVVVYFI